MAFYDVFVGFRHFVPLRDAISIKGEFTHAPRSQCSSSVIFKHDVNVDVSATYRPWLFHG